MKSSLQATEAFRQLLGPLEVRLPQLPGRRTSLHPKHSAAFWKHTELQRKAVFLEKSNEILQILHRSPLGKDQGSCCSRLTPGTALLVLGGFSNECMTH